MTKDPYKSIVDYSVFTKIGIHGGHFNIPLPYFNRRLQKIMRLYSGVLHCP
jgi:hypothetical protein